MGQPRPLFCSFKIPFQMTNISFEKSVDVVLGIRTQDRRMVVADEGKLLLLFHIEIVVKEIVDVSCFVIKRDLRWAGVVPSFTQFALLTELWRPPQIEEFLAPIFPRIFITRISTHLIMSSSMMTSLMTAASSAWSKFRKAFWPKKIREKSFLSFQKV